MHKANKIGALLLSWLSVLLLAGCSGPIVKNPTPVGAPVTKVRIPEQQYKIQVGDQLDVKFFYNPELNETLVVRPDGRISLQLIGAVMAAGDSPEQLSKQLEKQYASQLATPAVTVIVRSFTAQKIYVDGQVAQSGVLPLVGPMTVLQAITQSGGLTDVARTHEVIVIRHTPKYGTSVIPIDLTKVISGMDTKQDILLRPYDIVYVPLSPIGHVAKWVDLYLRKTALVLPQEFLLYYNLTR